MSAPPVEDSPRDELGRLGAMEERCRGLIKPTTGWPTPGTTFLDLSHLYCDSVALRSCVDALAARYRSADVTHVAGIDARGFGLGCALATALGAGFIMVRKRGKLPPKWNNSGAKLLSCAYELEYGVDGLEVASDILDSAAGGTNKVVVFDDIAATGGTAIAAANLMRDAGAVVHEVAVLVELSGKLQPRQRIKNEAFVRLHSLLVYDT